MRIKGKLISVIGYGCIALALMGLAIELLPSDVLSEMVLWVLSIFVNEAENTVYLKVVPSTSTISPVVILSVIGVLFVLLATYINSKK